MTEMKKLDANETKQKENKQPKDSEQSQVTEPKWPASVGDETSDLWRRWNAEGWSGGGRWWWGGVGNWTFLGKPHWTWNKLVRFIGGESYGQIADRGQPLKYNRSSGFPIHPYCLQIFLSRIIVLNKFLSGSQTMSKYEIMQKFDCV